MRTIEIDIDKISNNDELMETFQLKNLSKGDEIKFVSDDSDFSKKFWTISLIIVTVIIFFKLTR